MKPCLKPQLSSTTFTTGTRQFVVHEAFERTWCFAGSYFWWFTPITIVMSSPLAGAEMTTFFAPAARCLSASGRSEPAGTLEHEVHAQRLPRELLGLLDRRHFDRLAVDDQRIALRLDGAREPAVDGIVLQEMRERLGVGDVVHRHELERLLLHEHRGPEHVAPDATEPVDPDTHCHGSPLGEVRHDGPAEGHGRNRAGPGLVQRAGRLGQRGAGGEDVVYQNERPF